MSSVVDVLCALQSAQIRKTLLSCYRIFFQGVCPIFQGLHYNFGLHPEATTCGLRKNRSCLVACTRTILYFLAKDDPRQSYVQNSTFWISLVFEISFSLRTLFAPREFRSERNFVLDSWIGRIKSYSVIQTKKGLITAFFYILRSEPLFVTSAHDIFDNNGGKLTHPDSDICINIEPGTFPDGRQQPIFFHVIYDDTHVIRDIPETNKRTLISPVIKCGPEDINPHKAVEIVLPHCLYMDEVKKGSIEVYRCGQYTSEGSLSCRIRSH